ncbi:MAG: F0F1 ATP synthase subunit B [Patescibacteria group bacterium]
MSEPTSGIATLGINPQIFLAQLFNFVVVLLVLWKFAYKPLVKILDDRSKKIEDSLNMSKDVALRVSALEKDQKNLIANAKSDAAQILDMARTEAETRKQEMLASAKTEVERVVLQGKEQLRAEKINMIREAKAELIQIAVAATKKILEESIDEKKSSLLAEDVVKKMIAYEDHK